MPRAIFALIIGAGILFPIPANAAPNLIEVQGRVRDLQEQATEAAEGAQEAKVQLAKLKKTLDTVQQQASQQGASVTALNKTIGAIANERYKSGPLSQSLELLFSTDPGLYLSAAGSLEAVTRQKTADLKKFSVATQRLTATSLTVADKLAMVKAAEAKFTRQLALANSKLKEAEELLAKLTAAERERLAKLNDDQEDADQQKSLSDAGKRAQYRYGKAIARKDLQPGDLVFFGKPISHVAIYLGPDRMLHAPRSGSRVKIANMDMGRKPYIGARRL